jgi:hypothetical protein
MFPVNKQDFQVGNRTVTFYFGVRFLRSIMTEMDVDFNGLFAAVTSKPYDTMLKCMYVSANCKNLKNPAVTEDEILDHIDETGGVQSELWTEFQRLFMISLGVDPETADAEKIDVKDAEIVEADAKKN